MVIISSSVAIICTIGGSDQVWPNVKTQIVDTRPKMITMMTMSSTMIIPTINMMTKMRLTVENDVDDVDDDDDE